MNYTFRLVLILLLTAACSQGPELSFDTEIFDEESLDICKDDPCSDVSITYIIANGDANISEKINAQIKEHIISFLFLGDEASSNAKSISEAATDFVLMYRDHQVDIPSEIDPGGYEAELSISVISQTEHVISMKSDNYLYTGGAHGNGSTVFMNFNAQNGVLIDLSNLTKNFEEFEHFIESRFRSVYQLPKGKNINATGFWFPDDQFYVSNNVGFSENELIVLYNSYEIAPYAEGPIELKIPLEEVTPYLQLDEI